MKKVFLPVLAALAIFSALGNLRADEASVAVTTPAAIVFEEISTVETAPMEISTSTSASPSPLSQNAPPLLKLVYPRDGAKMPALKNSFVFGSVSPATAPVLINGTAIPVYRTGSFLAMIPFKEGEFKIRAEARNGDAVARAQTKVTVGGAQESFPASRPVLGADSLLPASDEIYVTGDVLNLRARGTSGCKASFRLLGAGNAGKIYRWHTLAERRGDGGSVYEGSLALRDPDLASHEFKVEYRLTHPKGNTAQKTAPGKIKINDPSAFSVAEVVADDTTLKTGPSIGNDQMGYDLFLAKGTRLRVTGKVGGEARIQLADDAVRWADFKNLKMLPENAPAPKTLIDTLRMKSGERGLTAAFDLREKVPYRVTVSDDLKTVTLTFFHAVANLDRFRYDDAAKDKWLEKARWHQRANEAVDVQFDLKQKLWGYDARFEGDRLVLEMLFPPQARRGLHGLTVALDPGHSPDAGDGAIGPQGITEGEVNFQIALRLKEKLEKEGAAVFMTRTAKESLPLPERGRRAWAAKADVFLSIHNNAVPDGSNPYDKGGFSVYYFQPGSIGLARKVHAEYGKKIKLKDEGLFYGNLAVCRVTQMPSILTESAYLILPEEEELLLSADFQDLIAEAVAEGLLQFVKSY